VKIGFILPLGEDTDLGRAPTWEEIRALAEQCEAAGLDSVWVYDHLLYRFEAHPGTVGVHECWSVLGTLVMPASWRNPALLAKMATTIDAITGGRLILGLGTGFHEPEFAAFGYPFDHRVDRFEEELQIITTLLREGKVDHHGRYHTIPNGELAPRYERPDGGHIPVLVACRGERMMRLTARHADAWNIAWFGNLEASAPARDAMTAACTETDRDPATLEVTIGLHLAPPDRHPDPEDEAQPRTTANHAVDRHPERSDGSPGEADESVDEVDTDNADTNPPPDPARVLQGTPEEVAAVLAAHRDAGVGHVIVGALAHTNYEYTRRTIAHLAETLKRM
jgi:alkanesulfonate monooxygenase SsuD/methylene tetrahydromethanopterin reductase-like flavin-dependent oxidoreductase (luciferase family)